jgi:hypothetical protein
MSASGRYCCKSLSGYEARNIDSSPEFAWQGRVKTLSAGERTLHGELIQLTFATLSAQTGPPRMSAVRRYDRRALGKPSSGVARLASHATVRGCEGTRPDRASPRRPVSCRAPN